MIYVAKQQTVSGGTTGGYDATWIGNTEVPTNSLPAAPGEPAALSTMSGKQNFATKIQPIIDTANKIMQTAGQLQKERAAAAAATPPAETVPADVQAEMDSVKSDQQKVTDAQLASYDRQTKTATDIYNGLTSAAKTSAQAQINSITGSWQERRALLEESNRADTANWTQQFIRSGQAEYSPGMTSSMLTQKEQEGIRKVKALDDEYNTNVSSINAELDSGNFKAAAQLSMDLQAIEDKQLQAMQDNAKEAAAVNKQLYDKKITQQRDTAIASLLGQGLSDPSKILDVLNKNGYNVTSDDVAGTLKNLTVSGNAKDISTDLKTFQYIRDTYGLPKDIAALPPEQQYFAYLAKLKSANTAPSRKTSSSSSSTSPTNAAPTWDEYLTAAEKAAGVNYFMAPDEALLRGQYETQYGNENSQAFTATELKKLEQAGLQSASRKEQLDYLYGKKAAADTQSGDLPPSLQ